ncbi:MAG: hypothetical protein JST92_26065, partial [Deltaproteobacteria bacterium]|nr:hypothetical protein [Deltaproteobacteria bacterium]
MTDDRRDTRHDTRGSGPRRPGPHQRRLEKQARLSESPSKPAGTVHRGHGPSGTRGEVHKGQRPQSPSVHTIRPTSGDDGEARVVLTQRGLERLKAGHPWVYRSDVDAHPALEGGAVVRLVDPRGWFVGKALYGQRSQIAIRLLSREDEVGDDAVNAAGGDLGHAGSDRKRPNP